MNGSYGRGGHWGLAIFGIAMAGLAAWAYWRFVATLLTLLVVGIALGCIGAALYVCWLARRSLPPPTARSSSPGGKGRP